MKKLHEILKNMFWSAVYIILMAAGIAFLISGFFQK